MNEGVSTWDARLAEQVKRKFKNYQPQRILLDDALDNKELPIAGDTLIVVNASSINALATVRLNNTSNEAVNLQLGRKISTIFTTLFFSCDAQTGEWLDVLAGIDFDIDFGDLLLSAANELIADAEAKAQPAIVVTNATANLNTVADDHSCRSAIIKSPSTNTGLVWVNIGDVAVEGSCYDLAIGGVIALPMSNTDQINALFKVASEKLIVIYAK
jgi:hypothetical protein